jgi:hypothetical protein
MFAQSPVEIRLSQFSSGIFRACLPASIALSPQEVKLHKHRQLGLNQKSLQKSLFFLLALATAPLAFGQTPASAPPDDAAVRERANLLLKQMTLELRAPSAS